MKRISGLWKTMKLFQTIISFLILFFACNESDKQENLNTLSPPPGYNILCNFDSTKFVAEINDFIIYANQQKRIPNSNYYDAVKQAWKWYSRDRSDEFFEIDTVLWKNCISNEFKKDSSDIALIESWVVDTIGEIEPAPIVDFKFEKNLSDIDSIESWVIDTN